MKGRAERKGERDEKETKERGETEKLNNRP